MNIETICKVMNDRPELQELYAERQNYPHFALAVDSLLENTYTDEEQLVYYLLWNLANLSVDVGILSRTLHMSNNFNNVLASCMDESITKTYYAEMRNFGLTKGLEDFRNAQPNGYRFSDEGDHDSR